MNDSKPKIEFAWHNLSLWGVLVVISVVAVVFALPREGRVSYKAQAGAPWRYADLTAPFDFAINKSEEVVARERDSILSLFEPYYMLNKEVEIRQLRRFAKDFSDGLPNLPNDYLAIISNRLHDLYQQGIMANDDYRQLMKDTLAQLRLIEGKEAWVVHVRDLLSTVTAYEKLFQYPHLADKRELLTKCNLNNYLIPNIILDKERSEVAHADLLNSIPLASGVMQQGQKIIGQGEIVTQEKLDILRSMEMEQARRQAQEKGISARLIGQTLYVTIIICCFTLFLTVFRRDQFDTLRTMAMPYALIVLFSVMASLLVGHHMFHVYLLPFAMVPIFISVFMDSRTAFMSLITTLLLVAIQLQRPFPFLVVETVSGLVAILSLRELSSRSQLFQTAIYSTFAAMMTSLAMEWVETGHLKPVNWHEYDYLAVQALLLFCTYPLMFLIEKAFGFISNITLIELSDMNKPLLRQMSEVAPGTFQHSIQVANLSAEIANKIGANSQLVRTGALYHDIGKISDPVYYTENQSGQNPHDSLNPIESAQVIISHVTEGLKLADRYHLPPVIKKFISTHHGQGKAKYFYVKYQNEHPDEPVDSLLFTYPGPNPQTKEQAILMMADTVEAASRSLTSYTETDLKQLVERLIDAQVQEGYFRNCPITFRDIAWAKTVLIEKLKTIYHTRISYPEQQAKEPANDTIGTHQ
jgi:hypothetical protein